MESLGEKLRSARESKGYSYDQVGQETNIARRYLEALESEDFSKFPGEPYALGFLRNYGEYLGLDVQELLSLYRALKIQEQPVPVEQLLKPQRRFPKLIVIILIVLLITAAAGAGLYHILKRPREAAAPVPQVRAPVSYTLEAGSLERRFYPGDSIIIPLEHEQFMLEISGLNDSVTLRTPEGTVLLALGQTQEIDITGSGRANIKITAADFIRNNPSIGALLRLELAEEPEPGEGEGIDIAAVPGENNAADTSPASGATTIFSSPNAYPFTLQANFKGYCMFRWESDRRDRSERYFTNSDILNIQAQNAIRIWASNAAAVRIQVIGGGRTVDLELGGPGEVVVSDVRWVRDEDGRFRLVLARLD
ncbi:helix-turn-helix domain-containing protein [Treponema sp. OttesenSCG-928-L16]|nr:helix-turn-helix domain-containing protein [Treponema sp. OttesenSCG-928-L16]